MEERRSLDDTVLNNSATLARGHRAPAVLMTSCRATVGSYHDLY